MNKNSLLFWQLLNDLEPIIDGMEAYPIYISPTYNKKLFEELIENVLEDYFPEN